MFSFFYVCVYVWHVGGRKERNVDIYMKHEKISPQKYLLIYTHVHIVLQTVVSVETCR